MPKEKAFSSNTIIVVSFPKVICCSNLGKRSGLLKLTETQLRSDEKTGDGFCGLRNKLYI
jgi:hypothetical protein